MNTIQEYQAYEYEAKSATLLNSFIHLMFPGYFKWKVRRRYKRYLGGMEYKKMLIQKRTELETDIRIRKYN